MAIHSSILAWESPWTEEPGGLQSMGSQSVGHGWESDDFSFHVTALMSRGIMASCSLLWTWGLDFGRAQGKGAPTI